MKKQLGTLRVGTLFTCSQGKKYMVHRRTENTCHVIDQENNRPNEFANCADVTVDREPEVTFIDGKFC